MEFKSFIDLKLNVNIYFLLVRIGKCHILLSGGCMLSVKSVVAVQMRKLHLNYNCMQRTGYYNLKKTLFSVEAKMTGVGVGRWLLSNIWVVKLICVDVGLYVYICVCVLVYMSEFNSKISR